MKTGAETKPFAVFDIESTRWDQFDLAATVTSSGAVEVLESRDELQAWAEGWQGNAWAHAGGMFDFLFLTGKDEVLLTGSRILSARVGKDCRLKDSFPMMPMSLKKLGEAVGVKKWEVDRTRLDQLSRKEVRDYCVQDCRVLLAALEAHRDFCLRVPHREPSWPSTSGATAVYCAEAWEREAVKHLGRHPLSPEAWLEHSSTVQGGRCELFQLGEVEGPVYAYDVKSSYPARYLEAPLPVGPWRPVGHEVHGAVGVWRVRFKQPTDRLPVLSADGVFAHEGEGWATSEELEAARLELGAEVEVLHGYISARVLPFGQTFVRELYALKEAGSPFAKVCLNSLHGKFGQRLLTDSFRRASKGYVRDEELSLPRWYQRPLIEAHILARARVALWRVMDRLRLAGHSVLYTDTDSVHTSCPPADFSRLTGAPLGKELGQWELKGTASRAVYLAPKVYGLQWEDGKTFVACKGIPPHLVNFDTITRAWEQPIELADRWGLEAFASTGDDGARARHFTRTLRAHPGAGKSRNGSQVWYAH